MPYSRLTLSLPGSGLDPLQFFEGAPLCLRSQTGTVQITGANPIGVPVATTLPLQSFVWTVTTAGTLAKKRLLQDYVYAQAANLGQVLLDDYDQPIAPNWLNWGNRTAIGDAQPNGDRFFRCPVVLVVPTDNPQDQRLGLAQGVDYFTMSFQCYEIPV